MVPHPVRAYRSILLTSEKLRMERLISGVLGPFSTRGSYLRKPSHRPVYILPNARREVSSGLRCPALRPFCFGHSRRGIRTVCLEPRPLRQFSDVLPDVIRCASLGAT